jgi:gamma-glutamylcyclotransferase (GGCT)/AIG2-like uncharacterized protein YtfP
MDDFVQRLRAINAARARGEVEDGAAVDARFDRPSTRLAVYGSLAPGEVNHDAIAHIRGIWCDGYVRGTVRMSGWGSRVGFPGMTWIPDGDEIPVKLLASAELPQYWHELDTFEGEDYVRILVPVHGLGEPVVANIYELREGPACDS